MIDWMLGEDGIADEPDRIVNIVLGAMRPAKNLKTPLRQWAASVTASFPRLSQDVADYLLRVPESTLQEQRQQHARQPQHAVTRRYLEDRTPTP